MGKEGREKKTVEFTVSYTGASVGKTVETDAERLIRLNKIADKIMESEKLSDNARVASSQKSIEIEAKADQLIRIADRMMKINKKVKFAKSSKKARVVIPSAASSQKSIEIEAKADLLISIANKMMGL